MMKFIVRSAAVAAVVVAASSAMAVEKLKIGISSEAYPPFSSQNATNQWEGFEIDLLAALCKEMKVECKIVSTAWDGIIPALKAKKIDSSVRWPTATRRNCPRFGDGSERIAL